MSLLRTRERRSVIYNTVVLESQGIPDAPCQPVRGAQGDIIYRLQPPVPVRAQYQHLAVEATHRKPASGQDAEAAIGLRSYAKQS